MKTYICKLCGKEIKAYAVPLIITKEELCVECYRTKYHAMRDAIDRFVKKEVK